MTDQQYADWYKTLTIEQQQAITQRGVAFENAGFQRGAAAADKEQKLNRILIPVAFIAFPLGVLMQRYLVVI